MTIDRQRLRRIRVLRTAYRWAKLLTGRPAELGMTSSNEQAYFLDYARSEYKGKGELVDLGSWLGSTTISLAKGLLRNPRAAAVRDRKIHAYDLFTWDEAMDPIVAGTSLQNRFEPGDSILAEFKRRTSQWAGVIEIHEGDICELGWSGGDIELLLIDAMKSWKLAESIVKDFFPSLIPHESIVIQQDFAFYYTSWIHLLHYRFRDHFTLHRDVAGSASTVFRYLDPIPPQLLGQAFSFASFAQDEIDAAFDHSLGLVTRDKWPEVASAKVMTFIHRGDLERARNEFQRLRGKGIPLKAGMRTVEALLG